MAKTRAEEIAKEDEEAYEANKKKFEKQEAEKKKREAKAKEHWKKSDKLFEMLTKKLTPSWPPKADMLATDPNPDPQNMLPSIEKGVPTTGAKSGGYVKKYAHGGGVRKTKLSDY